MLKKTIVIIGDFNPKLIFISAINYTLRKDLVLMSEEKSS